MQISTPSDEHFFAEKLDKVLLSSKELNNTPNKNQLIAELETTSSLYIFSARPEKLPQRVLKKCATKLFNDDYFKPVLFSLAQLFVKV